MRIECFYRLKFPEESEYTVKKILILLSFLMALHLVAGSSYGLFQINAEELVENNFLEELLEKQIEIKGEFVQPDFSFQHPEIGKSGAFHYSKYLHSFSSYVKEIHVPPPNFFEA